MARLSAEDMDVYVQENGKLVRNFANKHAKGNKELVKDAVQQAFLEVMEFDCSKARSNLKGALWSVAKRAILNVIRKEVRDSVIRMGEDHFDPDSL